MKIIYLESTSQFEVLKKSNQILVLDFYSEDCPPCEILAPIYEKMARVYPEILFVKAFRQEHRELALSFSVSGSPTVIFFKDGELQDPRLSGEIEESKFHDILKSLCGHNGITLNEEISEPKEKYDLTIIGNGAAGFSAAVYAARYKINQVLIGDLPGGLMTSAHKICNYPSETEISGMDLTQKMVDHINALGVLQKKFTRVVSIKEVGQFYHLKLSSGQVIQSKTVLLATGTKHRHLNLPKEVEFVGRGISYCATCDAQFYEDKIVAVIGGSDSATTAALYLADIAKKVYLIYRKGELRGEVAWIDQVKANDKITVVYNTNITEIIGDDQLTGLVLDRAYNEDTQLNLDGVFVEIGSDPDPTLINELSLDVDDGGYIKTNPNQSTSQIGIWAAGDITTNSDGFQQIVTAASEGAVAAGSIYKYLQANR